ncbi:unannotated protein [freshwater metagenome]|uniref:Unannotated protein n=1 Tax=freshwater metagenome TaxID=449393 RepID=A0A6J7XSB5_9ZZZZ|nr:hypothetical protein [Actinomycetota bacterium]
MFRKVTTSIVAVIFVAGFITAVPANAATKISNGVSCTKSGASTKYKGTSYKCTKNPTVKNAKLTWVSVDCINIAAAYKKSISNLAVVKSSTDATVATLDQKAAVAQTKLVAAQTSLAAAIAAGEPTSTINLWKTAISGYTRLSPTGSTYLLNRQNALDFYTQTKDETEQGLTMRNLICSKGM